MMGRMSGVYDFVLDGACFALLILLNLWISHFCIEEIYCDSLYMNRIYSDLLL